MIDKVATLDAHAVKSVGGLDGAGEERAACYAATGGTFGSIEGPQGAQGAVDGEGGGVGRGRGRGRR